MKRNNRMDDVWGAAGILFYVFGLFSLAMAFAFIGWSIVNY